MELQSNTVDKHTKGVIKSLGIKGMSVLSVLNRGGKLLRHVAMVLKTVNSHCFKLRRSYSISFNLSNVGEIRKDRI